VLTVTLLHPVQSTPVQSWTFEQESVVRIGRAMDNQVVLYSAVVSRHHVELRNTNGQWEVVNLGTNGTYLDGKRVNQAPLEDGGIIRLARSGPNLQVRLGNPNAPLPPHRVPAAVMVSPDLEAGTETITPEKATIAHEGETGETEAGSEDSEDDEEDDPVFYVTSALPLPFRTNSHLAAPKIVCNHAHARPLDIFCVDCGQPLKVEQRFGAYQVLKSLGNSGTTYQAWRDGQTVILKTVAAEVGRQSHLLKLFRRQVSATCQLSHPGLPQVYECFAVAGQPFLATEMVFGSSLWQKVATHGPIAPVQAMQWMVQLCHTLDYLHRQTPPLIHQSVCPSNLILPTTSRSGYDIVLVDLGTVLLATPDINTFVHDVAYTAPELQTGQGQTSSDLYSVGVTLVYLLTGQEPDHFFRWGTENHRLYVEDIPRLNPDIAMLIHQLTHPHPEARPTSALAVAKELQKLMLVAAEVH
jgi:eukaryotic-like serine/threonine-protein kinase